MKVARARWERCYPAVLAAAITLASGLLTPSARIISIAELLAAAMLNVWAILIGFVAAAMSILLTAQSLPALDKLKPTKQFHILVGYNWAALRWGVVALIACLVVVVASGNRAESRTAWPCALAWLGLQVLAFLMFYRALDLFRKLLGSP